MSLTVTQAKGYSIVKVEANKLGGVLSPELKDKFVELNQLGVKSMILDLIMVAIEEFSSTQTYEGSSGFLDCFNKVM